MKKRRYLTMMAWTRQTPRRAFFFEMLCRLLPGAAAVLYIATAGWLLFTHAPELPRFGVVPGLTLALVSLLRQVIKRPRPYEKWPEATPLLRSHHKGRSCPSRHAASGLILAAAGFFIHPVLGAVQLLLALGIGATRVVAGVHFISDVLAGYGLAALCGLLFLL